jgi:hypothetical protein
VAGGPPGSSPAVSWARLREGRSAALTGAVPASRAPAGSGGGSGAVDGSSGLLAGSTARRPASPRPRSLVGVTLGTAALRSVAADGAVETLDLAWSGVSCLFQVTLPSVELGEVEARRSDTLEAAQGGVRGLWGPSEGRDGVGAQEIADQRHNGTSR